MTRAIARPDYVQFATGQLDPVIPVAPRGGWIARWPSTRRRRPYLGHCRLHASR